MERTKCQASLASSGRAAFLTACNGSRISLTFGKNLQDLIAFLKSGSSVAASIPPNASSHGGSLGATSSLCSTPKRNSHSLINFSGESERPCVLDGEIGSSWFSIYPLPRCGQDRAVRKFVDVGTEVREGIALLDGECFG